MAGGLGCFPLGRPTCLVRPGSRPLPLRHSEFDILWQALTPPRKFSALPPRGLDGASPKAVSGRTSYLRVRLEFLRYPHLIPTLFNGCGSGPPAPFTASSAWTRIDHPVSGLRLPTLRPVKARFPSGSARLALNLAGTRSSPDRSTKSTRLRLCASAACKHRVSGSLSLPSRGSFHLSFTVLCSIGHWAVFSLAGRSPPLPPGFHVSRRTPDTAAPLPAWGTGLSPSAAGFPKAVPLPYAVAYAVHTPQRTRCGLGSSGFARRYSRNRCFFLFLRLLRCFSSPGSPPCVMDWRTDARVFPVRVSPFRDLRITGHVLLPAAYRSLSRLSSAPSAKASALCSFCLASPAFPSCAVASARKCLPVLYDRTVFLAFVS